MYVPVDPSPIYMEWGLPAYVHHTDILNGLLIPFDHGYLFIYLAEFPSAL